MRSFVKKIMVFAWVQALKSRIQEHLTISVVGYLQSTFSSSDFTITLTMSRITTYLYFWLLIEECMQLNNEYPVKNGSGFFLEINKCPKMPLQKYLYTAHSC